MLYVHVRQSAQAARTHVIQRVISAGSVEEGYTVTPEFVQDMLQRFKDQKLIHRRYAFAIILQVSPLRLPGCRVRAGGLIHHALHEWWFAVLEQDRPMHTAAVKHPDALSTWSCFCRPMRS